MQGCVGRDARCGLAEDDLRVRIAAPRSMGAGPGGSAAQPESSRVRAVRRCVRAVGQVLAGQSAEAAHGAHGPGDGLDRASARAVVRRSPARFRCRRPSRAVGDRTREPDVHAPHRRGVHHRPRCRRAGPLTGSALPAALLCHSSDRVRLPGEVRLHPGRAHLRRDDRDLHRCLRRVPQPATAARPGPTPRAVGGQ